MLELEWQNKSHEEQSFINWLITTKYSENSIKFWNEAKLRFPILPLPTATVFEDLVFLYWNNNSISIELEISDSFGWFYKNRDVVLGSEENVYILPDEFWHCLQQVSA